MIHLDSGDHRPVYEQIVDKIKELIISGALDENDKIPSVRELASSLAINPNTIQKAYKELESEGYIYSQKSRGSFVSPQKESAASNRADELAEGIKPILTEMKFLGMDKDDLMKIVDEIYEEE